MSKKLFKLVICLSILLWTQSLEAQTSASRSTSANEAPKQPSYTKVKSKHSYRTDTIKNTDFSLNGQYNFMLSRSRTTNSYKLVNPYRLSSLWQSVNDTLKKERQQLVQAKAKVVEQETTIANLQNELTGKENSLNSHNLKLSEINFLGLTLDKNLYHILVWSIIGILVIALVVVIARSTKNILEAKHRTQLYDEIAAEYQSFKAKSNEKERKLARELQDERNLVEEMKNRS